MPELLEILKAILTALEYQNQLLESLVDLEDGRRAAAEKSRVDMDSALGGLTAEIEKLTPGMGAAVEQMLKGVTK